MSKHLFPKNPLRRDQWIKSIPRANWSPSASSVVCSLHFHEEDFKTERCDSNSRRNLGELKSKRLKSDAVPRIFPGLPSYLSVPKPKDRPSTSTSTARRERQAQALEDEAKLFLSQDNIENFEQLSANIPTDFPPSWNIITLKNEEQIFFDEISFNEEGKPAFRFSLSVKTDLELCLFSKDISVPVSKVLYITDNGRIKRYSDVFNILAFLNSYSEVPPKPEDVINSCISKLNGLLENVDDEEENQLKKVSFILEQLKLVNQSPHKRRYSTNFLWMAITWQKTSPVLYKLMSQEAFLTLPSTSYLKQLSGAFSLQSGVSPSTMAYLKERVSNLTAEEKVVALAIDEVSF